MGPTLMSNATRVKLKPKTAPWLGAVCFVGWRMPYGLLNVVNSDHLNNPYSRPPTLYPSFSPLLRV